MDATDNELLETQSYGCCVVDFYLNTSTHLESRQGRAGSRPVAPLSAGRIVEIPQVAVCTTATTAQRRSDGSKSPVVSVRVRQLTEGLRVFSQGRHRWRMLRVGVMPPGAPRLNANL